MRHINENTDELFQKAAEDYPLKTGNPDWEDVRLKLEQKTVTRKFLKGNTSVQLVQQYAALFLLLLIPLETVVTGITFNTALIVRNTIPGIGNQKIVTPVDLSEAALHSGNNTTANPHVYASVNDAHKSLYEAGSFDLVKSNIKIMELAPVLTDGNKLATNSNSALQNIILNANITNIHPEKNTVVDISNEVTTKEKQAALQAKDKDETIILKTHHTSKFYAGALVAMELTNVKAQPFRKPGFNGGFLLGYDVSKRVQAEVGIELSHKYFYTDGKYAAPNSIRHDEAEIAGVNAFSSVTEIPVTIRYNINSNENKKFFVAAGAVSSIVHKERYNYGYTKNDREKKGFRKYSKSADNLFSNMQLSFGYEQKIGKLGNIRIEPYYQLPLNGIGVGNLPVTSVGINLGLIKHFK